MWTRLRRTGAGCNPVRPLTEMKGPVKDEARNWIERRFESVLWNSRFLTLVAVVASLLGAIVMFFVAASDVLGLFSLARQYSNNALTVPEHLALRARIVASIAQSVDGFLFALVLIIFALGIYELFIGSLHPPHRGWRRARFGSATARDPVARRPQREACQDHLPDPDRPLLRVRPRHECQHGERPAVPRSRHCLDRDRDMFTKRKEAP